MSQQSIEQFRDQDADLAVCTTCGNQYSSQQGPPECPVCYGGYNTSCGQLVLSQALQLQFSSGIIALAKPSLAFFIIVSTDDRQYPCPTGQVYTSQRQLLPKTTFQLVPEESDDRILRLKLYPPVAISQTAILLLTRYGAVIWHCCGFVSVELVEQVCKLSPTGKVAAIFISHPHLFGTSLTWAKMLDCNVFISRLDRQWYQRGLDCIHPHPDLAARKQYVIEIQEDRSIPPQIPSVTLIRCGSHFPGSKALHWDAKGAAVFCADTFMVMPDCKRFTFAYSFPNNIPLPPHDVEKIWMQMRPFQWSATFGGWSGRQILSDSRSTLLRSARYYIKMEGHPVDTFKQLREEQA